MRVTHAEFPHQKPMSISQITVVRNNRAVGYQRSAGVFDWLFESGRPFKASTETYTYQLLPTFT